MNSFLLKPIKETIPNNVDTFLHFNAISTDSAVNTLTGRLIGL